MKKRKLPKLLMAAVLAFALTGSAFAASSSWSTNKDYYMPEYGTITSEFYPGTATTTLTFKYSSAATSSIAAQYSAGRAIGMDIKNVTSAGTTSGVHKMEATPGIATTLPNPKEDIENELFNSRANEAEIMATTQPSPHIEYEMIVIWKDHRTGADGDNGQWNVNAELSEKSFTGEWNVWDYHYESCAQLQYGTR